MHIRHTYFVVTTFYRLKRVIILVGQLSGYRLVVVENMTTKTEKCSVKVTFEWKNNEIESHKINFAPSPFHK